MKEAKWAMLVFVVLCLIGIALSVGYITGGTEARSQIQASCDSSQSVTYINGKEYLCGKWAEAQAAINEAMQRAYLAGKLGGSGAQHDTERGMGNLRQNGTAQEQSGGT